MYGSRKTLELIDSENIRNVSGSGVLQDIDAQIIELRKERQKLFDQRSAFSKLIRDRSRQEELNEIITEAVCGGSLPSLGFAASADNAATGHGDNDLLVSLNDIHYGACIDNKWNTYNSDICVQMMRTYLDRIIDIGKRHRSENCICWMNGDAISGNIHYSIAVTNKENVIQQVTGVAELLSEFVAALSSHFKTVRFVSVSGNHSRINPNKDKTLSSERLDDLIEWYMKARLQSFENVLFDYDKVDDTIYTIDIRGKTYCGVHGDYDLGEQKVQALQTMVGRPVYAVLSGHLHHNKVDSVQGIKTVMAGSFMGMDDYCIQKRIYGKAEQMVCVCDDTGIMCHYDICLSYHKNSSEQ